MTNSGSLFIEAWKAGIELSINGDKLHFKASSKPSNELLAKLKVHKPELLRFLSCWIDTPYGQAKFWGFLSKDRCGIILRNHPDRVTWIRRGQLMIKAEQEDRAALIQ